MELTNLFGLLEDFNEDLSESIYKTFEEKLVARKFERTGILLDIAEPVKNFYYLYQGQAWGVSNKNKTSWFCEENEIILFDRSLMDNTFSSYRIMIGKDSIIYQISKDDLYNTSKKSVINDMLKNHLIANTQYFMGLNDALKGLTLKEKLLLLAKRHYNFVFDSSLEILSTFLDASCGKICSNRRLLKVKKRYL